MHPSWDAGLKSGRFSLTRGAFAIPLQVKGPIWLNERSASPTRPTKAFSMRPTSIGFHDRQLSFVMQWSCRGAEDLVHAEARLAASLAQNWRVLVTRNLGSSAAWILVEYRSKKASAEKPVFLVFAAVDVRHGSAKHLSLSVDDYSTTNGHAVECCNGRLLPDRL